MSDYKDIDLGDLLTQLESSTSTFVKKGAIIPILKWLICRASQLDELLADTFIDADDSDEDHSDSDHPSSASTAVQEVLTDADLSESQQSDIDEPQRESKSSSLLRNGGQMLLNPMAMQEVPSARSYSSVRKEVQQQTRTPWELQSQSGPGAVSGESLSSYIRRVSLPPQAPPRS